MFIWCMIGLGVEVECRGKGIDFVYVVFVFIWCGIKDWDKGDYLVKVIFNIGFDFSDMEVVMKEFNVKVEVDKNYVVLEEVGYWGVLIMVVNGEFFFG